MNVRDSYGQNHKEIITWIDLDWLRRELKSQHPYAERNTWAKRWKLDGYHFCDI
jgi:hypothetical protein